MIRDRKMYVAPTPFGLVDGVAHTQTLILPQGIPAARGFREVGCIVRTEASELIVGYAFDLRSNILTPQKVPNPGSGRDHPFMAWRLAGGSRQAVAPRSPAGVGESTSEHEAEEDR